MDNAPRGEVTFLFTDIEGSTKLAQEFPDTLPLVLEKHHSILRNCIESNNGYIFEIIGDAFCASFENADEAVKAAHEIQLKLGEEEWHKVPVKVRIGIHKGSAEWSGIRYIGYLSLARTHRVMSVANGGQVLISNEVHNDIAGKTLPGITLRDLGERRLKDLKQPVRLYQVVAEGIPKEFPPLKTLDARPNNLPIQLTSFVGREKEISDIKNLFLKTHLLTLLGPGGTGKTRLCIEIAADIVDDFANGVWLIELASLHDQSYVLQEISSTLKINLDGKKKMIDEVKDYLSEKEILLILDNCEHLIDECARISDFLLRYCPKLKILASSREAMQIAGEAVYHVSSLNLPDMKKSLTADLLLSYESVNLFIERATFAKPDFKINDEGIKTVAKLCHSLEGIPLAIELAAAAVKVLSLEDILEKLNDRFDLLSGGRRTALPRHQTLRAMIDWSYDLLPDKEKIVLQRLSLLTGYWTFEAANEVCVDEKISNKEIFLLISNLINKSLLFTHQIEDRMYYSMLQIIQQYGYEKLESSEEGSKIRKRYFDYYLKLSKEYKSKLTAGNEKYWLEIIETEHDNFRQAIAWAAKSEPDIALEMAVSMSNFWVFRGYFAEGFNTLKNVLKECKTSNENLKAEVLSDAGYIACEHGEYKHAKIFLDKSLSLFRKLHNPEGISKTLVSLGLLHSYKNESDKAYELFQEALSISRKINDKTCLINSLVNIGALHITKGHYDLSQSLYEEALSLARELNHTYSMARILTNLATIEYYKSNYEKANLFYEESLLLLRELGDHQGIAHTLANLANTAIKQNSFLEAEQLNEECLDISREFGYKSTMMLSLMRLADLALGNGNFIKAKKLYLEYLQLIKPEQKDKLAAWFKEFGKIHLAMGDLDKSIQLFSASEEFFKSLDVISQGTMEELESYFKELRNRVGIRKFEFAYESIKPLTFEQILEFAKAKENDRVL